MYSRAKLYIQEAIIPTIIAIGGVFANSTKTLFKAKKISKFFSNSKSTPFFGRVIAYISASSNILVTSTSKVPKVMSSFKKINSEKDNKSSYSTIIAFKFLGFLFIGLSSVLNYLTIIQINKKIAHQVFDITLEDTLWKELLSQGTAIFFAFSIFTLNWCNNIRKIEKNAENFILFTNKNIFNENLSSILKATTLTSLGIIGTSLLAYNTMQKLTINNNLIPSVMQASLPYMYLATNFYYLFIIKTLTIQGVFLQQNKFENNKIKFSTCFLNEIMKSAKIIDSTTSILNHFIAMNKMLNKLWGLPYNHIFTITFSLASSLSVLLSEAKTAQFLFKKTEKAACKIENNSFYRNHSLFSDKKNSLKNSFHHQDLRFNNLAFSHCKNN